MSYGLVLSSSDVPRTECHMPRCTWAAQSRKTIISSSRHGYWFKWQFLSAMQHHIEILSPEIQCPPLCSCAIVVKDSKLNFILWNWAWHSLFIQPFWILILSSTGFAPTPIAGFQTFIWSWLTSSFYTFFQVTDKTIVLFRDKNKALRNATKTYLCTLKSSNWSATLQTERAAWFKQLQIRQLVFASNSSIGTSSQECHENPCQHLA